VSTLIELNMFNLFGNFWWKICQIFVVCNWLGINFWTDFST